MITVWIMTPISLYAEVSSIEELANNIHYLHDWITMYGFISIRAFKSLFGLECTNSFEGQLGIKVKEGYSFVMYPTKAASWYNPDGQEMWVVDYLKVES